ncbi:MAG: TIGR00282 family metallophosphoesterase, partial [Chloroherpetonaceae bacterium]|nr:YmdB family metallophosphoesterase [Chthonomonadaceae bacterium]MDW8207632.1 TIGR00282 family metallophosphoesterase [Chloroherpetonaceae bacterium]
MRILMIGDVVGRPGRQAVAQYLPVLTSRYQVDFIVCNAENAAAGAGITAEIARTLLEEVGIHVITLGNHAWARKEIYPYLNTETRILRPFNYPPVVPGRGYGVYEIPAGRIGVIALQGRTFMEPVDDPFRAIDTILNEVLPQTRIVLVDFHAEATSEKQAFAWYVDGRVSAVIGTHTHVQTADERILPSG